MATTPAGEVWYASLAGDHIAKIDTTTGAATVIDPPKPGSGPRRIWSDSKGVLWVSLWNIGAIGRYDPVAKSRKTYQLPNATHGRYSHYAEHKNRDWTTDLSAHATT